MNKYSKILASLMIVLSISVFMYGCGSDKQTGNYGKSSDNKSTISIKDWTSQLPEPPNGINHVNKYSGTEKLAKDDTSTKPTSVNIILNGMTSKEAFTYYKDVKASGAEIVADEKNDDKILLTGNLKDGKQFVYSYDYDDKYGNISLNFDVI